MGAILALVAMLCAFAPSLQAMACAVEGCNPACSEQPEVAASSHTGERASDGCVEKHCVCAAGHCSHAAVSIATVDLGSIAISRSTKLGYDAERPVFAAPHTLERPPRA